MFIPDLLISGGQTGADQGGLRAAVTLGIPTGGYAPKGYWTENEEDLTLRDTYGLMEHESRFDYAPRTEANVKLSQATIIFGRRSQGSNLTEGLCQRHTRPFLWVPMPLKWKSEKARELARVRIFLMAHRPTCLNIAGNRESKTPGIGAAVETFLIEVWQA